MYRCDFCNTVVGPKVSCSVVVTHVADKEYDYREDVYKKRNEEGRLVFSDDPGGRGWEIVAEKKACPKCSKLHSEPKKVVRPKKITLLNQ